MKRRTCDLWTYIWPIKVDDLIKFNKEESMKTGIKVAQKQHRLENDDSSRSSAAVDERMSWFTSYQLINDYEKTITI